MDFADVAATKLLLDSLYINIHKVIKSRDPGFFSVFQFLLSSCAKCLSTQYGRVTSPLFCRIFAGFLNQVEIQVLS